MRALVFAVLVAAAMAGRAEAAWRPAGVVARDMVPRVASPSAEGGLRVWGGDLRLTWAPGLLRTRARDPAAVSGWVGRYGDDVVGEGSR